MRQAVTILALGLLLACALVLPAAAGKQLAIKRASEVTEQVAHRDCKRDRDCERSEAVDCRRLARLRVSCVASIAGTDERGAYRCDRLVLVRLSDDGDTRHAAGKPSCYRA